MSYSSVMQEIYKLVLLKEKERYVCGIYDSVRKCFKIHKVNGGSVVVVYISKKTAEYYSVYEI